MVRTMTNFLDDPPLVFAVIFVVAVLAGVYVFIKTYRKEKRLRETPLRPEDLSGKKVV